MTPSTQSALRGGGLWLAALLVADGVLWAFTGRSAAQALLICASVGGVIGIVATFIGVSGPSAKSLIRLRRLPGRGYVIPAEMPPPPAIFIGRDDDIQRVVRIVEGRRVSLRARPFVLVLHGEPGVGKSGFALKVAATLAHRFTDGAVYSSMTDAFGENERLSNVLGDTVDALQGPGDEPPDSLGKKKRAFRRLSKRKPRVLYLLDDVVDPGAAKTLLPKSGQAVVLITTRLRSLDLGGAKQVEVLPLPMQARMQLLRRLLPAHGDSQEHEVALRRVAVATGGYPLALRLAVLAISYRGMWGLEELTKGLPEREDEVTPESQLTSMLELSYRVLTDVQRRTLESLVWLDEPTFVPWMVQGLAGLGDAADSDDDAWRICDRLADLRLLERVSTRATGVTRMRLPDRVKAYLLAKVNTAGPEADAARAKARAGLEAVRKRRTSPTAKQIMQHLNSGQAAKALDSARAVLSDAVEAAESAQRQRSARDSLSVSAGTGWPEPAAVPSESTRGALAILAEVLAELGGLDDALEIATLQQRLEEQPAGSGKTPVDIAEVRLQRCLGKLRRRSGELREAVACLQKASKLASGVDDVEEWILTLRELAIAESTAGLKHARRTLADAWKVLETATGLDANVRTYLSCRLTEADTMLLLTETEDAVVRPDDLDRALEALDAALKALPDGYELWGAWLRFQRTRVIIRQAELASRRAKEQTELADGDIVAAPVRARTLRLDARQAAEEALDAFGKFSHRFGAARCRLEIGRSYVREREFEAAIPMLEEARETLFFCGDRLVEAHAALDLAGARLDRIYQLKHNAAESGGAPVLAEEIVAATRAAEQELEFVTLVMKSIRDRAGSKKARTLRGRLKQLEESL